MPQDTLPKFEVYQTRVREHAWPYRTVCDLEDNEFPPEERADQGLLIASALNIHRETRLTPDQLLAQRAQLLEPLRWIGAQVRGDIWLALRDQPGAKEWIEQMKNITEISHVKPQAS
jgi:hypothetical protein